MHNCRKTETWPGSHVQVSINVAARQQGVHASMLTKGDAVHAHQSPGRRADSLEHDQITCTLARIPPDLSSKVPYTSIQTNCCDDTMRTHKPNQTASNRANKKQNLPLSIRGLPRRLKRAKKTHIQTRPNNPERPTQSSQPTFRPPNQPTKRGRRRDFAFQVIPHTHSRGAATGPS